MKISCPACSAKYSITDDKVQDRLAKIRCRKCGATIVIDGKTQPPNVYTSATEGGGEAAEPSEPNNTEYSVDFGEGDQRTLGLKDLVAAYKGGQITGDTYVWADGFADWKPLGEIPEIVEALNAGGGAPAAAAAPAPSPWEGKAAASPKAPASLAPRAAARTGGRTAGSADLFSRIDSAGSEDDVSTSAPEQPSPLATPSASTGTGARNESSVLFSLSALTSAAQNAPRSSSANGASRDDSGLIDLKALTAAAMKNDATGAPPAVAPAFAPVTPAPLGVAPPLGFGTPLGAPVGLGNVADLNMPQPKSKAPLFIGGGLAIGLIAVAAAILLKPEPPPPPPAPVIVTPPPAQVAAPAPTPEAIAKPPATGTTEEEAPKSGTAPKKAAPRAGGGGGTAKKPPSGGTSSGATEKPAESKPAAPKRSPCGCASGDLQCAMRCAAKGG